MPTYYVRKTGSDAAAGTSAGAAWLTIDKAANTVAAGDTVYIGAGYYREAVTMDTSGSSGSKIRFIADIAGGQTGDPGLVVISGYDNSTGSPARNDCLVFQDKEFIEWYGVIFQSGWNWVVSGVHATNVAYEGVVFESCAFVSTSIPGSAYDAVWMDMNEGATPSTEGITFKKCTFVNAGLGLGYDNNASAAHNFKIVVENCMFFHNIKAAFAVSCRLQLVNDNTEKSGGMKINNCAFHHSYAAASGYLAQSTAYPVDVRNCTFMACVIGVERFGGTAGAVTSDYNTFINVGSAHSGVTAGTNDISGGEYALLGGYVDHMLYEVFGWSPYKPWEPIDGSGLIDNGTATGMPTEDFYGNPRPMGRNAYDVGPVEARIRPAQEASTVYAGTYSARFDGAGYYDAMRAVDAASTTITVYCQKDANYTGTAPKLEVVNIPGVADQSDSLSVGSGSWEQLSVTFTPTSAGWVRIRLWSYDTSATGKCFFDDLAVA